MDRPPRLRALVVAGPSGSGKTTVGLALAARLGWAFADADAYHGAAARRQMSRGEGLTDAQRGPWLDRLHALLRRHVADGPPVVLACSALHDGLRDRLIGSLDAVGIVWLEVGRAELDRRLARRPTHFAGPSLLPSQLDAAVPPPPGPRAVVVDAEEPPGRIVGQIASWLKAER